MKPNFKSIATLVTEPVLANHTVLRLFAPELPEIAIGAI